MLNKNILIPGVFIENIHDHTVYQVQTNMHQVLVLRNISTDAIVSLPISSLNLFDYEVVTIEPNYKF